MAVKGGDFYVNLGIKGSDKTKADLDSTDNSFKKLKETSLGTKAAILAAFYGLDKLAGAAGQYGLTLSNLSTITGASTKTLQEWAFAAAQAGTTAESFYSSFDKAQDQMFAVLKGGQPPEWFLMMIGMLQKGGFKLDVNSTIKNLQEHPEDLMILNQEFALLPGISAATKKGVLREEGWGDDLIADFMKGVFNFKNLNYAKQFESNDSQIKNLNDTAIAINNFNEAIKSLMNEIFGDTRLVIDLFKLLTKIPLSAKSLIGNPKKYFMNLNSDLAHAVRPQSSSRVVSVQNHTQVNIHGASAGDVRRLKQAVSDVNAMNNAILYNFVSLGKSS